MVTTIIPTIGRDTLWTRALPSALAQGGEVIVVGDGWEPPETPGVVTAMVERQPAPDPLSAWRWGGVAAFNRGLELATGEWVSYLADDDAYRPGHHAALLAASANVDIVYGQSQVHGIDGTHIRDRFFGNRWPLEPYDVVQGSYIMRRSVVVPATMPTDKSWDAAWWLDVLERRLRTVMVDAVVHDYYPAPENAHHHGADTW